MVATDQRSGSRANAARVASTTMAAPPMTSNLDELYDPYPGDEDKAKQTNPSANRRRSTAATARKQTLTAGKAHGLRATSPVTPQGGSASTTKPQLAKQVEFNVWVVRKDKYERVVRAITQLNIERATDDQNWFDLAVSLAATDCVLKTGRSEKCDCPGICHDPAHAVPRQKTRCQCPAKKCSLCKRCIGTSPGLITDKMIQALDPFRATTKESCLSIAEKVVGAGEGGTLSKNGPKITTGVIRMAQSVLNQCSVQLNDAGMPVQRPCSCPVRSLGDIWVKWTTKYHTFSRVALTEAQANEFSSSTRQMMEFDAESKTYYMTLKWHVAAKAQKGDTAKIAARRQLSKDQKKQNKLFLSLCKKTWHQAQSRVVEYLQTKVHSFAKKERQPEQEFKDNVNEDDDEEDASTDSADAAVSTATAATTTTSSIKVSSRLAEQEVRVLNALGVKRILKWVEEDAEDKEQDARKEKQEKAEGGLVAHNAWVKKKERLRIRMPVSTSDPTNPKRPGTHGASGSVMAGGGAARFDFSHKGIVRKKYLKFPSSTVELMQNSGLKYVHAMNEGFQGRHGDLEKSKMALKKQQKTQQAVAQQKWRESKCKQSFNNWLVQKALRDKALKFLEHIPKPTEQEEDQDDPDEHTSGHGTHEKNEYEDDEFESGGPGSTSRATSHWEQVGRALKAVDRTLFDAWVTWSSGFCANATTKCRILWESFDPIACDVHCTSSSIRDVFLKLLHRREIDYKQAFEQFCETKYRKQVARQQIEENDELDQDNDAKMEFFNQLNAREFGQLMNQCGLVLQPEEMLRLVEFFDADGDGLVSMKEFLQVMGQDKRTSKRLGDTGELLQHVCMWETVCHECGMLNAFQLVIGNPTSTAAGGGGGGSSRRMTESQNQRLHRMRAELPGHMKRRAMKRFQCHPECDMQKVKQVAPKRCAFSQWDDAKRHQSLKQLEIWSCVQRDQHALTSLLTRGLPPGPPSFFRDHDTSIDPTSMILLRWLPPQVDSLKNNGASFYVLETAGEEGSVSFRQSSFTELYRDPKNYEDNGGKPRYHFVVTGLQANTKYLFRVRALNGFGAGPFVFGHFSTFPEMPPSPFALRVSANAITLCWERAQFFDKQLKELRKLFDEIDEDGNGQISRDELMHEIEKKRPRLMEFLQKLPSHHHSSNNNAESPPTPTNHRTFLSVFDAIETDDNELISWEEFQRFFRGCLPTSDSTNGATTCANNCRFILKQCTNEEQGEYVEIYHGTKTHFTVHGLASASTYQFRVQAVNESENLSSLHSEPAIVNTLLLTPASPTLAEPPTSQSVRLRWTSCDAKPRISNEALQAKSKLASANLPKGARHDDQIAFLLKEWAGEHKTDGGGAVDFRKKFDRYDVDGSNFIELGEFVTLLEELGVSATRERIAWYLEEFDEDGDGRISFEEFTKWWNKVDVTFVLKRTDTNKSMMSNQDPEGDESGADDPTRAGENYSIVCYRGQQLTTQVSGLEPNTKYSFRLRAVASHAASQLSEPLEIWTAPNAPTCAGIVATTATTATLNWFAGDHGAFKFVVEVRFMETLFDGSRSGGGATTLTLAANALAANSQEWLRAYEGTESFAVLKDLVPNSVYRVRVFALNAMGMSSEQSTVSQFYTKTKDEDKRNALKPSNAAEIFQIECCQPGDILRGDTILFSERLFGASFGSIESNAARRKTVRSTNGFVNGIGSSRSGTRSTSGSKSSRDDEDTEPIGERTVAARVVSVMERSHPSHHLSNSTNTASRIVNLEVIWCTVQLYEPFLMPTKVPSGTKRGSRSSRASTSHRMGDVEAAQAALAASAQASLASSFMLTVESKITRREKQLYFFEAFRTKWQDENARHARTWDRDDDHSSSLAQQ